MKKIIFINILVIFLLCGCFRNEETHFKLGQITLPITRPYAMVPHSIIIDDNDVIILQSFADKKLHYFILDSLSLLSYGMMSASNTIEANFYEIFVKNWDSVIIFNSQDNMILISDSSGNSIFEYTPETEMTFATVPPGLTFHENAILMSYTSSYLNVFNKSDRIKFYRTINPIVEIGICNYKDNKETIWGMFPTKYQDGNEIYLDFFPNIVSLQESTLLVSYAYDDSIYVYKDGRIDQRYNCKSKFIKRQLSYPEDKQFDMVFYKDYLMFEPKYLKILYNKYADQYYRIAKHRVTPKSKNENKIKEMKWSIIVMNREFEIVNEVVFDYRYHSPDVVLSARHGVYISNAGGPDMSESTTLTLFKL